MMFCVEIVIAQCHFPSFQHSQIMFKRDILRNLLLDSDVRVGFPHHVMHRYFEVIFKA